MLDAYNAGRAVGGSDWARADALDAAEREAIATSGFGAARRIEPFKAAPAKPRRKAAAPKRTREELTAALAEVERVKGARAARRSLAEFVRQGWHVAHPGETLEWNWHMQTVCDHVQFVVEELLHARRDATYKMRVQNLLINIPPRSAKTMIVGVFAPAWCWLQDPTLSIRYLSGIRKVVTLTSIASRDLFASAWFRETFRPTWEMRADVDSIGLTQNTEHGHRMSSAMGDKVTGTGTDIIIIDDPHDAQDAYSDVKRQAVTDKWDSAIRNRVKHAKRCVRIGIMQRLHEADWAGHVTAKLQTNSFGRWEHVVIPQEFEAARAPTIIGWVDPRTVEGELLHPERFPAEVLEVEKVELGSYGYAGQHQQRPAPLDGGLFKKSWWQWYEPHSIEHPLPRFDRVILSIDSSFWSINEDASRVSILVIGQLGHRRYVLDNETRVRTFLETKSAILRILKVWNERQPTFVVLIELKANGSSVIETLQVTEGLSGVVGFDPQRDSKTSRAMAVQPFCEARDIYLPKHTGWTDSFVHEFSVFPNGAHDDQVDAFSQALIYMRGSVGASRTIMLSMGGAPS